MNATNNNMMKRSKKFHVTNAKQGNDAPSHVRITIFPVFLRELRASVVKIITVYGEHRGTATIR